jgi:hypothetical protein
MAVEKDTERKAVNIKWDKAAVGANAIATCTNPDTGDVSTTDDLGGDGFGVITFPSDYKGKCDITVTGNVGEDTGTITV